MVMRRILFLLVVSTLSTCIFTQTSNPVEGCTNWNNITGCTSCQASYFLQRQRCVSCSSGCANCSNANTCISCLDGYFKDETTGGCSRNYEYEGCSNWNIKDGCVGCQDGYFFQERQCFSCPSGCASCINSSNCLACLNHHLMSRNSSNCVPTYGAICGTNRVIPNCLGCNASSDTCTECHKGYFVDYRYYNYEKERCSPCLSSCETCKSEDACQKCFPGYYLNKEGGCTLLPKK